MYSVLGRIVLEDGTKASAMAAVGHFVKQRDISKAIGHQHGLRTAEYNIAYAMSKFTSREFSRDRDDGRTDISVDEQLRQAQVGYTSNVEGFGQGSIATINTGVDLAVALKDAYHGIEAEILLTKLASRSKRFHGPGHQLTQQVESNLQNCKVRVVAILRVETRLNSHLQECKVREVGSKVGGELEHFQSLRYTEDDKKCVVQGQITDPRNTDEEKQNTATSSVIRITLGTPVVCHGLKRATHLNGKIGDVRAYKRLIDSYEVHFEDKELDPRLVKPDNIRILFELPDEL